jgi:pimeloyl-ACP methyl ester carboxylesterase
MTPAGVVERFEVRSYDGTLIPVTKSGSGIPLMLVHGARGPAAWAGLRPLVEPFRTVITVTRRSTFVDPSLRYDLEREFEDIAAVARAASGDQLDLIGQSSGAVCALGAALRMPNLRRLVLYEPPLLTATESNITNMESLMQAGDLEGAAESFFVDSVKLSPETVAAWKAGSGWREIVANAPFQIREEAILRAWEPESDFLSTLRVPTMLLVGARTPNGHHHRGYVNLLRSAGVNFTLVEIPNQEHAAHLEDPQLFAKLVREFLEAD